MATTSKSEPVKPLLLCGWKVGLRSALGELSIPCKEPALWSVFKDGKMVGRVCAAHAAQAIKHDLKLG